MHLDLTDEESAALTRELHDIIESDRYPFSPRIRTLRAILAKLRPEPARERLPPPKVYAPPRATAVRKEPARLGEAPYTYRTPQEVMFEMSWGKGLRRLWIVGTAIWIVGFVAFGDQYFEWRF
jgi:hypothetical protein